MTLSMRPATLDDADTISALITSLAEQYITGEFTEEGRATLLRSMTPDAIRSHIAEGYRYHVAEASGNLAGVVATRDNAHLYHLFVAERFHGQGLARELWLLASRACLKEGNPGQFTVNSSRFAVGFYEKMGFHSQRQENRSGVVAVRMRLDTGE